MHIHPLIWILYLKSSSCLLMRSLSRFHFVLRSLSSRAFAFSSFLICLFLRFIRSCSAKVMRYWGPIRTRSWWAELTMTLLLFMYCFWELLLLSAELCVTKHLTVLQKKLNRVTKFFNFVTKNYCFKWQETKLCHNKQVKIYVTQNVELSQKRIVTNPSTMSQDIHCGIRS